MDIFDFANKEWNKYLYQMCSNYIECKISFVLNKEILNISDCADDAFKVEIKNGNGIIISSNERSCLLATYECLYRLGCIFYSPEEENVPTGLIIEDINLSFSFKAADRYRGVAPCAPKEINSYISFIKWLPKVGYNSIFFEGWSGYLSYRSWYHHEENPYLVKEENFSLKKALEYDEQCIRLAKDMGLIVHAMGHGWNVACISNDKYNDMYPDENTIINYDFVAEINGEKNIPMNIIRCTNLCLSNAELQNKLVNMVVDYAIDNPLVDVIHFWLADGFNKTCECNECLKDTFSDQYVGILNKIDDALSKRGIYTKIGFLVYNDTLYAPVNSKINNPSRFIMLFCPISREYSSSFLQAKADYSFIEYKRNKILCPTRNDFFLTYLSRWMESFSGDVVAFDYHLYYGSRFDISNYEISRILSEDIEAYRKIGLKGLINCGFYRNFFPNPLLYLTSARGLLDKEFNYHSFKKYILEMYYGKTYNSMNEILNNISQSIPTSFFEWYSEIEEYRLNNLRRMINKTDIVNLLSLVSNYRCNECLNLNEHFLYVVKIICEILLIDQDDKNSMLTKLNDLKDSILPIENDLLPYLSVDHLFQMLYWYIYNS